tara:strand:+ start:32 stop:1168 length:1137 start_codon:yes stop_codon:yes gene_type:complete
LKNKFKQSFYAITLFLIIACSPSSQEKEEIAVLSCNIMGESRNMDAAFRIKEINSAREQIGEERFLGLDADIKTSFEFNLCKELVLNDKTYKEKLEEKLIERKIASQKAYEEETIRKQKESEERKAREEKLQKEKEERRRIAEEKRAKEKAENERIALAKEDEKKRFKQNLEKNIRSSLAEYELKLNRAWMNTPSRLNVKINHSCEQLLGLYGEIEVIFSISNKTAFAKLIDWNEISQIKEIKYGGNQPCREEIYPVKEKWTKDTDFTFTSLEKDALYETFNKRGSGRVDSHVKELKLKILGMELDTHTMSFYLDAQDEFLKTNPKYTQLFSIMEIMEIITKCFDSESNIIPDSIFDQRSCPKRIEFEQPIIFSWQSN